MAGNVRLFSCTGGGSFRQYTNTFLHSNSRRRFIMTKAGQQLVLISGANQGLGFEIAKRLATTEDGYHILLGARAANKGKEAVKKLEAEHPDAKSTVGFIELNVSSDESIASCIKQIEKEHGHLDVLINNSGVAPTSTEVEALPTEREKWARIYDTNVTSLALLTEAAIPMLQKSTNPRIVNISSSLGSTAWRLDPKGKFYGINPPPYSATKCAVGNLTAIYAQRLAEEGFQINCCCPGFLRTAMNKFMDIAGDPADGAIVPTRLATLNKGSGMTGKFIDIDGEIPW